MSDVIEKNDVDISKIFNWGRVYEIVDPMDETKNVLVYMKLLGDADLGKARVYAMRKSSELRRKLKEADSDERLAYIRGFDEISKDELIKLIVIFSGRDIANAARESVNLPVPKPPKSNARLEKMEKFQKEVDEYPAKRLKLINEAISKEVEKLTNSLTNKSKEELYTEYVRTLIDEFCEREAIVAFEDMQTFLGCFTDNTYKERFFRNAETGEADFAEFNNLEPTVKQQFKDAYRSIDIEVGELKKLRRVTP